MNQKLSWSLLVGGLALFLTDLSHVLATHATWGYFATPPAAGEIVGAMATALVAVIGALGVRLNGHADNGGK